MLACLSDISYSFLLKEQVDQLYIYLIKCIEVYTLLLDKQRYTAQQLVVLHAPMGGERRDTERPGWSERLWRTKRSSGVHLEPGALHARSDTLLALRETEKQKSNSLNRWNNRILFHVVFSKDHC